MTHQRMTGRRMALALVLVFVTAGLLMVKTRRCSGGASQRTPGTVRSHPDHR